jgi:hypothetical protein
METLIIKTGCYFVFIPAGDGKRSMWINLMKIITVEEREEGELRVWVEEDGILLKGERAQEMRKALKEVTKII